eukprot:gene37177-11532_t
MWGGRLEGRCSYLVSNAAAEGAACSVDAQGRTFTFPPGVAAVGAALLLKGGALQPQGTDILGGPCAMLTEAVVIVGSPPPPPPPTVTLSGPAEMACMAVVKAAAEVGSGDAQWSWSVVAPTGNAALNGAAAAALGKEEMSFMGSGVQNSQSITVNATVCDSWHQCRWATHTVLVNSVAAPPTLVVAEKATKQDLQSKVSLALDLELQQG